MKTIAILIIAALIGSSHQQDNANPAKFRETAEGCLKETGVDPELTGKAFREGDFADDNNLKCFFKCLFEKTGHVDASGKIDINGIVDRLDPSVKAKMGDIITKCSQIKADDTCQLAFDVAKCMRESWKQIMSN